jgi:hypothetical protein
MCLSQIDIKRPWSRSPRVAQVLRTTSRKIHTLARSRGFWRPGEVTPHRPKELLEVVLRRSGLRHSADGNCSGVAASAVRPPCDAKYYPVAGENNDNLAAVAQEIL